MVSDRLSERFDYARTDQRIRDLLRDLLLDDICVRKHLPDEVPASSQTIPSSLPENVGAYLRQCTRTLERFPAPSHQSNAWIAWSADLARLLELCQRFNPDSDGFERLVLATSVPRFCHLAEWLNWMGPLRRDLHGRATAHLAKSWTPARIAADAGRLRGRLTVGGTRALSKRSRRQRWNVDVIDSYSTTLMLRNELHDYRWSLEQALKYEIEVDPLSDRPQRPLASLEFLSALLELRMLLDVQRWGLLELGGDLFQDHDKPVAELVTTDARLRVAFIRIVQRIPLYVGATPNLGDHQYGRTEHYAQRLLIERYHEVFFPAAKPPRQTEEEEWLLRPIPPRDVVWSAPEYTVESIPASSAMALLYDVLFLLSEERKAEIEVACIDEAIYFETKRLARRRVTEKITSIARLGRHLRAESFCPAFPQGHSRDYPTSVRCCYSNRSETGRMGK